MKVQPINNNSSSMVFGASIVFANPKNSGVMYSARAKNLVEQLKKMPDAKIEIKYVKGKSPEDSFLTARNQTTGVKMSERVADGEYSYELDGLSKKSVGLSDTFSNLLEAIMNPYYLIHKDFWYGEKQFEPSFNTDGIKSFVA